jgi:3-oxoacyl-[acyl-carrier protein] reductase
VYFTATFCKGSCRKNMKTVLVTGGARGIGRAVCKTFADEGYFVIINYQKSKDGPRRLGIAIQQRPFPGRCGG